MPGARRKVKPMRTAVSALRATLRHRAGVLEGVAQRLLAQHVLPGGDQSFHHLAMQIVGDDHADDVDVGVLSNRLPGCVSCARSRTA